MLIVLFVTTRIIVIEAARKGCLAEREKRRVLQTWKRVCRNIQIRRNNWFFIESFACRPKCFCCFILGTTIGWNGIWSEKHATGTGGSAEGKEASGASPKIAVYTTAVPNATTMHAAPLRHGSFLSSKGSCCVSSLRCFNVLAFSLQLVQRLAIPNHHLRWYLKTSKKLNNS